MENPWIASLTVAGVMVTVAVVGVLGCMVAGQNKESIQKEG
jgi:hypothetical protein